MRGIEKMPLYVYIKEKPGNRKTDRKKITLKKPKILVKSDFFRQKRTQIVFPKWVQKAGPVAFILLGLFFLAFAGWPILSYQVNYRLRAPTENLIKPVSSGIGGGSGYVLSASDADLNKASNWFVNAPAQKRESEITEYTLSIPKLKIDEAKVAVGGEDLSKSLIHYGGTTIPGNAGTAVVFGHSVLPQFFNPKDYHTIFATLPTLEVGDKVLVKVDGVSYKYVVYGMKTVEPTDLSVLEQHFDNYYLYIITCVPPGLDVERLVVQSKLERI